MDKRTILKTVSYNMGVSSNWIMLKCRRADIVRARQVCIYFARTYKLGTQTEIAEYFGRMDHSSVVSSIKAFKNEYDTNKYFRVKVDQIEEILKEDERTRKLEFTINDEDNYDYQYIR
jgi:chromosomal replication initiation ATPase DnaA